MLRNNHGQVRGRSSSTVDVLEVSRVVLQHCRRSRRRPKRAPSLDCRSADCPFESLWGEQIFLSDDPGLKGSRMFPCVLILYYLCVKKHVQR